MAKGTPCIHSSLQRTLSQAFRISGNAGHQVGPNVRRNHKHLCGLSGDQPVVSFKRRYRIVKLPVLVEQSLLEGFAVMARCQPGKRSERRADPLASKGQRLSQHDNDVATSTVHDSLQRQAITEAAIQIKPIADSDELVVKDRHGGCSPKGFP